MKIIFSDIAKLEYEEIVFLLNEKYGKQVAVKFINQLKAQLKILKHFPESFSYYFDTNYRKFMVASHITVIYKINEIENRIEILNFWFNRTSPELVLHHLK